MLFRLSEVRPPRYTGHLVSDCYNYIDVDCTKLALKSLNILETKPQTSH